MFIQLSSRARDIADTGFLPSGSSELKGRGKRERRQGQVGGERMQTNKELLQ